MAVGADGKDERNFNHPFFQAWAMFLGELLCMFTFYGLYYYWKKRDKHDEHKLVKGNRSYNPLFLLPSAMCDMIASSVMYVGLVFTYASSYEMLRGAVIIFVGILSILFLGRKLVAREWCGIVLVIFGLGLVGLSDFIIHSHSDQDESNSDIDKQYNIVEVIFGDVLIVSAQVVAATQFILEEKFVSSLDIPPLQAVGWEGLFGVIVLGILLIPFYYIKVPDSFSINSRGVLEDIPDAFIQMGNNPLIIMPMLNYPFSLVGQHSFLQLCRYKCDQRDVCNHTNGIEQFADSLYMDGFFGIGVAKISLGSGNELLYRCLAIFFKLLMIYKV
uniref:EamA domain-containing protein n=1 Tax=Timema tahoe TaxID=61484 RepID=A0A7R9IIM1_9NEOP|nr:unnamed protein product [Timema tahoe]